MTTPLPAHTPTTTNTSAAQLSAFTAARSPTLTTPASAVIDYILDDGAEDRLKELFDLFDVDGNGRIQRQELTNVLGLCAHEIGLEVDRYLEQITDAVFSHAFDTQTGDITLEGLRQVLKQRPNLINELELAAGAKQRDSDLPFRRCRMHAFTCLLDKWDSLLGSMTSKLPFLNKLRWQYISNNYTKTVFCLVIILLSALLYILRIFAYWGSCGFVIVARASGQCLNFFSSVIVLLVCRRSISYMRAHGFGRYLPVDDHVYFHKLIGWLILFHSLLHTSGHLANFVVLANEPGNKHTWLEYVFSTHLGIGWVNGTACVTGWFLLLITFVMAFAQPYSRSCGRFELFYYTHLLFIPFWILLLIHAPNFWKWFLLPFAIFFSETLVRTRNLIRYLLSDDETTIIKGVPLPSNVLQLVIKRPPNFDYNPGDWIYVLIPKIAMYEWHPFTISSAPEQEDVLTLHIRAVGEWTNSLRSYFAGTHHRNHLTRFIRSGQFSMSIDTGSKLFTTIDLSDSDSAKVLGAQKAAAAAAAAAAVGGQRASVARLASISLQTIPEHKTVNVSEQQQSTDDLLSPVAASRRVSQKCIISERARPNLRILIDGPYGSPSGQIFRSEHAVLIATGIGVTPFASILQSIVHHNDKRRQKCPSCSCEFFDSRRPVACKLRKVDFVWINRSQESFEWFIKLLAELELSQSNMSHEERFLDIHIHLTAIEKSKIKSIGMQLALYLMHETNKKDLVTGLKTRTKAGRPNWDEFFGKLAAQNKGKVSVFFCGRPQLGRHLHRHCDKFGFKFRKEIF